MAALDPAIAGGLPDPQSQLSETCSDEWQALEKTHIQARPGGHVSGEG